MKLRDPWTKGGKVAYNGPVFKKYGIEPVNKANKTFYVGMDQFFKHFDSVNVAMISDDWILTQKEYKKSTSDSYRMAISNPETQDV